MYIERKSSDFSEPFYGTWPDSDIGNEMTIHYIYVYPVGARCFHSQDFFTEPTEISGKNGGGNFFHHTPAFSVLLKLMKKCALCHFESRLLIERQYTIDANLSIITERKKRPLTK
jgi:hypothetical protein